MPRVTNNPPVSSCQLAKGNSSQKPREKVERCARARLSDTQSGLFTTTRVFMAGALVAMATGISQVAMLTGLAVMTVFGRKQICKPTTQQKPQIKSSKSQRPLPKSSKKQPSTLSRSLKTGPLASSLLNPSDQQSSSLVSNSRVRGSSPTESQLSNFGLSSIENKGVDLLALHQVSLAITPDSQTLLAALMNVSPALRQYLKEKPALIMSSMSESNPTASNVGARSLIVREETASPLPSRITTSSGSSIEIVPDKASSSSPSAPSMRQRGIERLLRDPSSVRPLFRGETIAVPPSFASILNASPAKAISPRVSKSSLPRPKETVSSRRSAISPRVSAISPRVLTISSRVFKPSLPRPKKVGSSASTLNASPAKAISPRVSKIRARSLAASKPSLCHPRNVGSSHPQANTFLVSSPTVKNLILEAFKMLQAGSPEHIGNLELRSLQPFPNSVSKLIRSPFEPRCLLPELAAIEVPQRAVVEALEMPHSLRRLILSPIRDAQLNSPTLEPRNLFPQRASVEESVNTPPTLLTSIPAFLRASSAFARASIARRRRTNG